MHRMLEEDTFQTSSVKTGIFVMLASPRNRKFTREWSHTWPDFML